MEEALYDTSRLIEAYRKRDAIHGYTTILNLIEFPKAAELDLRILYPSKSDYNLALKISLELLKIGKPLPAVDCVIAAVAINNGLRVITGDSHFEFIKEIRRDFEVLVEE